ncbi:MAG: tetratricopeptide repeat protein [Gaiellaceae bacterium]
MDARAELERAFAFDTNGDEAEAIPSYRRALELGLDDRETMAAMLGLGSSLRNVGELDESVDVLRAACERFPEHRALPVFYAYSLWSSDRGADAMRVVVDTLLAASEAPELVRYTRSIRGYAAEL